MFDEKEIEAYRSISAPSDLRERVLSSYVAEKPVKRNFSGTIRMVSNLAACLILVIALSVFAVGNFGDVSVSVSGQEILPDSAVSIHAEEIVAPLSVQQTEKSVTPSVAFPILLNLSEKTEISVSDGELQTTNDADGSMTSCTALTADGETLIYWSIDPGAQEKAFVLTLRSALKSETIILSYDEIGNVWTISRENTN